MASSRTLPVLFIFFFWSSAHAQSDLTEVEVFHRCYGQMAKARPTAAQPLLAQVSSGSKSAINACMEVLKKADFTTNGGTEISNRSDTEAVNVLHTFNALHSSWFTKRRFNTNAEFCTNDLHADLYDPAHPALFITRSLFRTDVQYSNILSGNQGFQSIRTDMNPAVGPSTNLAWFIEYTGLDGVKAPWAARFNPKGTLFGIQPATTLMAPIMLVKGSAPIERRDLNLDLHQSHGGGLLGTQSYLLATIAEDPEQSAPHSYSTDGAVRLPRRWAKYVYSDLLCRDLPVIRAGDATPFVDATSSIGFRKGASCTRCHASMDRTAMGIRDVRYAANAECNAYQTPRFGGFLAMYREPASLPQETKWPTAADTNFYKRPAKGVLYYRSYDGRLVHKSFMGLDGLGSAITSENDFYVCTAKRYMEFFTGISANLQDITDPQNPIALNQKEKAFRDLVIQFGVSLKQHQNLQSLVRDIISSPYYRKKDFGAGETP